MEEKLFGEIKSDSNELIGDKKLIRLSEVKNGSTVKVVKIDSGYDAKTRLNHLGIVPGTNIQLECSAPFKGPVCVKVRGTQLCIGRGLAYKVFVEKIDDGLEFCESTN